MSTKKKNGSHEVFIMVALLLIFIAIISFIIWHLTSFRGLLLSEGEDIAKRATLDYAIELEGRLELARRRTGEFAASLSPMPDESDILDYFRALLAGEDGISFLHFYSGGEARDSSGYLLKDGDPGAGIVNARLSQLIENRAAGCSGLIYDSSRRSDTYIAYYAPVVDNSLLDGIAVYFSARDLLSGMRSLSESMAGKSEYLAVCANDGAVIVSYQGSSMPESSLTNLYDRLREMSGDKSVSDRLRLSLTGEAASLSFAIGEGADLRTLVALSSQASDNTLFIANIFNTKDLIAGGYDFVDSFAVTLIIFVLVVIVAVVYMMRVRAHSLDKIKNIDNINPLLECNTFKKFSIDTEEILNKNKITKFALVYTELEQFRFITESYESIIPDDVLRFLAKVFKMSMQQDETYGHISDDKFVLLIHYGDEAALMSRLRTINAIVFNYPEMKKLRSNLKMSIGVCCIDRTKNEPIQKLLDRAVIAQKTNAQNTAEAINIYSEKAKNSFMRKAEIEARKEEALAGGEFRVFYQPKYNIAQNRPDGAEALVRWFDTESGSFRNTAEFIPIFEANGFIGRVDRYVYVEVCKYISEAVGRGERVIPISVNVSRVTATQDGFVEFYIRTKKKYSIPDNFLTIEFTESFAFENYDMLKEIIRKLKSNGFHCSIDDFGSGYSSYNILKELPMDELKLDRFFITHGFSKERDDRLLKTIIGLAKELGMKVTQEGVETADALERLEKFGCDVIQGYYYSKPLSLSDYITFLGGGGSIQRY